MTVQEQDVKVITEYLRKEGLTDPGIAGLLGNFDAESGIVPCRMEGDGDWPNYPRSQEYAKKVSSGAISAETFAHDGIGWGIYQLTWWSRKKEFLTDCRAAGEFIGDVMPQIKFCVKELKRDYPGIWATLRDPACTSYQSSKLILQEFEKPEGYKLDKVINYRHSLAQKWEKFIATLKPGEEPDDPEPEEPTFWPPRTLCKGMLGRDVTLLQAILACRGYSTVTDGIFGKHLEAKVAEFQKAAFPGTPAEWDGIAGPKTWAKLLDREVRV